MASSLNTTGSTTQGFVPKLATSLGFNSNANYGIQPRQTQTQSSSAAYPTFPTPSAQPTEVNTATGGYSRAPGTTTGVYHPTAPSSNVASHTTTTNPDGTTTTKQTYTPTPPQAPGTNFQQNLGSIGTASTYGNDKENAIQKGLLDAGLYYGNKGAAPLGGFNIGGAAQGFQQAQAALLNSQVAAAQPALQDIQAQRQSQLGGAETTAGLTAPQQTSPTTGYYSPGTNQFIQTSGSAAGTGGLASIGALNQQQQQGGTVQAQVGNQAQAQALTGQLIDTINKSGFNSINGGLGTQAISGITQWLNNQAGDPQYQNAYNLITEIASKYSNILNASGGTPTDVSTTSHNIINKLATGESIKDVINELDKNATKSIDALRSASTNNAVSNPPSSSANSGIYNF